MKSYSNMLLKQQKQLLGKLPKKIYLNKNYIELAEIPKIEWSNKIVFKLFVENGDGSVWNIIGTNTTSSLIDYSLSWDTSLDIDSNEYFLKTLVHKKYISKYICSILMNIGYDMCNDMTFLICSYY